MTSVRTRDTNLERAIAIEFKSLGLKWTANDEKLPGKPDFVFYQRRVAVFVDGDFWHGFRFPQWRKRISPFWRAKIDGNRRRDKLVHRKLRRLGWKVLRLWGHEIKRDSRAAARRVVRAAHDF